MPARSVLSRRHFILSGALLAFAPVPSRLASLQEPNSMYGLISKIEAIPGQRDALAEILLDGVSGMPGCRSYVVAKEHEDPDALWITEVWDSRESHEASLTLPSVRDAISKGRPLIAGFSERITTEPVGGHGLT